MNRRDLIQSFIGAVPAASLGQRGAHPHPAEDDLFIVEVLGDITPELAERIRAAVDGVVVRMAHLPRECLR